jgi:hypothetical protein
MVQHVWAECGGLDCDGMCRPAGEPLFAYTVGLFGMRHPELVMFGLAQPASQAALNELGEAIRAGGNFVAGETVYVDALRQAVVFEALPNPGDIVCFANWFYERPAFASLPALQVTYPDGAGRYPWDDGYSLPAGQQPRPGEYVPPPLS